MSAADGRLHAATHLGRRSVLAHGHHSASPATLTISGRQADTSWLHLSRKQDRLKPEVGALPTPSATLAVCQHLTATPQRKETYATCHPLPKPVALSQELQTKSCHPNPTDGPAERHFSSDATVRFETPTGTRLVAQKVFAHGH